MTTIVSVDGIIGPTESAQISIFDRGFLYGDSVYEVIRTYEGVPFELQRHLDRLHESAQRIAMRLPVGLEQLTEEVLQTHRASTNADSYLRVVVTRGAGPIGLDVSLAQNQRRFVIAKPLDEVTPSDDVYVDGVKIALVSVRRNLRTAIDPQAKTGNYLNSVMALMEARKEGAFEAIMLGHKGHITEGASSNVFAVVGDTVLTPPLEAGILMGITRRVVLEVARENEIRILELPLTEDVLLNADEAFITSSIREIVPVVQVDDQVLGLGRPGPVVTKIRELFSDYATAHITANR
jgi:branched-chain amino acid aminotransferase